MMYDISADPTGKTVKREKKAHSRSDVSDQGTEEKPLAGKPRKFKELERVMNNDEYDDEDYDDEDDDKARGGARRNPNKRARISGKDPVDGNALANKAFESGSEEEFVPGHTIKLANKDATARPN